MAPSDYIREHYPDVARSYDEPDEDGHPRRIIESVGEGVVLTSLEHSGAADYLGVVRPRFAKAERLAAVLRAFGFHGRPYDFDFDFMTDDALVCSELVFKAYQPLLEKTGRGFGLARTSGRFVLPPNNIVRRFDEEFGAEDAALEFVLFLDGSEKDGRAYPADAATFRETWRRPKWDIAQK